MDEKNKIIQLEKTNKELNYFIDDLIRISLDFIQENKDSEVELSELKEEIQELKLENQRLRDELEWSRYEGDEI